MVRLLDQLPFRPHKHPIQVCLSYQRIVFQGDVVYSSKDCCWMNEHGRESSQRQELCNMWIALFLLLVLPLPRGSACGPLVCVHWAWKTAQEQHVPQLPAEMHRRRGLKTAHELTFTPKPPSAFLPFQALSPQPVRHRCCQPPRDVTGKREEASLLLSWEGKCSVTWVPSNRLQARLRFWLTVYRQKPDAALNTQMLTALNKSDFPENLSCERCGFLVL